MAKVDFIRYSKQEDFDRKAETNHDAIYFVKDTLRIYSGSLLYSQDVVELSTKPQFPPTSNKVYIFTDEPDKVYFGTTTVFIDLTASSGGGSTGGVGITLNGSVIGGVKELLENGDSLIIPQHWQYNVENSLTLQEGSEILDSGAIYIG